MPSLHTASQVICRHRPSRPAFSTTGRCMAGGITARLGTLRIGEWVRDQRRASASKAANKANVHAFQGAPTMSSRMSRWTSSTAPVETSLTLTAGWPAANLASHHTLTLCSGDKLYLAPLKKDQVRKALDVGTGTGRSTSRTPPPWKRD